MKLTPEERIIEFNYLYNERIGILCVGKEPTKEQQEIATQEANRLITEIEDYHNDFKS
jgi:hypothetical protein